MSDDGKVGEGVDDMVAESAGLITGRISRVVLDGSAFDVRVA